MAIGNNKELIEIKAMMKQLAASVTAKAATVATLSTKTNGGISGAEKNRQEEGKFRLERVCALKVRSIPQGRELFGVGGE